jgi:glycosyltransferase involved in cell wall biosynthesis
MINILHIINGWPPGGITEQTYLLCKHLPKDKFKQYSLGYCHFDGVFVKKFEDVGVDCIKSDEQYSNLEQILKEKKIDIVHKQTGGGDFPEYCSLLKELNIPLIESLHCPRASGIPVDLVEKIVYTTPYTLYKNSPEHMKKMVSINYALDLEKPFKNNTKNKKEKLVVGRLGRIVPDKKIDAILEVAKMCHNEFGDRIQFHLAGQIPKDYPLHVKYGEYFIEEVETIPNVEYFGYVDNKYDFWKTLDVCINPVWEASFEVVFLEAMACGVPILTWDNSCAKYVVRNAGLIAEENIYSLYDNLIKLYEDWGLRKILGIIGIKYIETDYSLESLIRKYVDLYEGVLRR